MRASESLLWLAITTVALDNGAAPVPPRGLTTWELLNFNVTAIALVDLADDMITSGLAAAGFDILWLDDGWSACTKFVGAMGVSACAVPAPRKSDGSVVPDLTKFPAGLTPVFDAIHSRGLRVGIYTAPHGVTCGGYTGALGHEAIDAATFVAWGVDAVKLDAGCRDDASIHDGSLLTSLGRFRDALNATGKRIVLYIDDGNPTSGPKVVNPSARGWPNNTFTRTHIARNWLEFVASWGPMNANMFKIWFDRWDSFGSLMDNVHQQVNLAWAQAPGAFFAPDQMTIGQGSLLPAEERSEVFLYAVLSAPMFVSAAPSRLNAAQLALLTNPEIIAVNADADGVMASQISSLTGHALEDERWAFDVWAKPMHDGSFVFVAVNRDPTTARTLMLSLGDGADGSSSDIFPGGVVARTRVRDLAACTELGVFDRTWSTTVGPHDAIIVRTWAV
jgi:alpha-galactosidase